MNSYFLFIYLGVHWPYFTQNNSPVN